MGWTSRSWLDEIAAVLNTPEWHNAVITILDESKSTSTWDIETNERTSTGNPVIAAGIHARINWPLRSVTDPGTADFDPTTIRSGRVSIDNREYSGELRNGMQMIVTDGGRSQDLKRYRFRVAEALNSSYMISRVFKITVDSEVAEDA
jgi:hypothetical protein